MNHRPRCPRPVTALLLGLLLAAGPATSPLAADAVRGDFLPETDIRSPRKDESKTSPAIEWSGSIGAAYIDAEDGSKIWLTPFSLDARLNRNTTLIIEGDGYGHINLDGNTTQGFNNITLIASHVVYRNEASRVRLALGASAPGSNGIGSSGAKQRISASYSRRLSSSWAILVAAKLTRRNQDPRPGERRFEQYGRLQTSYSLDQPTASSLVPRSLIVHLDRDYRHGAGGSTQATASYDFPLSAKLGASIGFTRGLTAGLRDNTFAFDLLFGF